MSDSSPSQRVSFRPNGTRHELTQSAVDERLRGNPRSLSAPTTSALSPAVARGQRQSSAAAAHAVCGKCVRVSRAPPTIRPMYGGWTSEAAG